MADKVFKRDVVITVGTLRIASRLLDTTREQLGISTEEITNILKAEFNITKTLKKEPNKCELSIYNLKKSSRIAFQARKQQVVVEAGYLDNTSQLFSGTLEYASSVHDGLDWITTLQASDGTKQMKSARINTSIKGPAKVKDVLSTAAAAMGLNPGNLARTVAKGALRGNLTEFTNGIVLSGKAEKVLGGIAESMGYSFSVQDGQLIFLGKNDSLGTTVPVISPSTGMVGSPEPGEDGFINVRTMIQPNLLPGHRIRIESASVQGFYRIEQTDFSGDTWGQNWYADLECRPLGGAS